MWIWMKLLFSISKSKALMENIDNLKIKQRRWNDKTIPRTPCLNNERKVNKKWLFFLRIGKVLFFWLLKTFCFPARRQHIEVHPPALHLHLTHAVPFPPFSRGRGSDGPNYTDSGPVSKMCARVFVGRPHSLQTWLLSECISGNLAYLELVLLCCTNPMVNTIF